MRFAASPLVVAVALGFLSRSVLEEEDDVIDHAPLDAQSSPHPEAVEEVAP